MTNWQAYADRMNTWQALNPSATPEEREAASLLIERDVENQSRKARACNPKSRHVTDLPLRTHLALRTDDL